MSEYRDDLASAHRRIEQLEDELAAARGAPRPRRRRDVGWWIGLGVGGALLGLGGLATISALVAVRGASRVEAPAPVVMTPVAPVMIGTHYFAQREAPIRADVDGDGKPEIVGLFWSGANDKPMWVAALDSETFAAKWAVGPYPAQWNGTRTHLAVVGAHVVVTDSQSTIHTLSLKDGEDEGIEEVESGVTELCALGGAHEGKARVRIGEAWPLDARLFDPGPRELSILPTGASCAKQVATCDDRPSKKGAPSTSARCIQYGAPNAPIPAAKKQEIFSTYGEGDLRVSVSKSTLFGWEHGASGVAWEKPIVVGNDEMHFGGAKTEASGGRVATLYQTKAGPFRLVVRDLQTGNELGRAFVPRSTEGSYLAAFSIDRDYVFVAMDNGLVVFDAKNASLVRDLESVSLPTSR